MALQFKYLPTLVVIKSLGWISPFTSAIFLSEVYKVDVVTTSAFSLAKLKAKICELLRGACSAAPLITLMALLV